MNYIKVCLNEMLYGKRKIAQGYKTRAITRIDNATLDALKEEAIF